MTDPAATPTPVLAWRPTTLHHRGGWPEGYWKTAVGRGLRLRCPVCGKGKLFATYFRMRNLRVLRGLPGRRPVCGSLDINPC